MMNEGALKSHPGFVRIIMCVLKCFKMAINDNKNAKLVFRLFCVV